MRRTFAFRLFVYCAIVLIADPRLAFAARSQGIDVSDFQGDITPTEWTQIRNDGKDFAWTKATEGFTFNATTFVNNMVRGTAAGVYMGAYHYARPDNNSAITEAQHFVAVAGPYLGNGYLRPMLDIENESFGLSTAALSTWINDFCTYVTDRYPDADPIIYISASPAASEVNSSVTIHDLDVAQYGTNPVDPAVPTGNPSTGVWNGNWAFWQYGSQGRVNGIGGGTANCDVDVANGDINFVRTFLIGPPPATSFERFDVNNATGGSGVVANGNYTWEAAKFSSSSAGTDATAWNEGNFMRLAAGTDAGTNNYTITANSNHTIAGMYLQTGGGGTVTINGPGVLTLASGDQGVFVDDANQNLKINAVIAGSGKLIWQGTGGSLFLLGANTYTGGTALNSGSGLNFNNNQSFGTGRITWGYTGGTATQFVLANDVATAPVTLANPVTTMAGGTLVYVGPAVAPVTFTGAWTMPSGISTMRIGNATHTSSKMTISGAMGGSGGALVKDGVGTLVLSGANTYTGGTTITAGTLQIGDGGTTGKLSTTGAITNSGSLIFNRSNTVTQGTDFSASAITGTGTLTQAGSGTLVLTATNTYNGKTIVNAGTLSVSTEANLGNVPFSTVSDQLAINGATFQATASLSISPTRGITIGSSGATIKVTSGSLNVISAITNLTGSTVTITGGGDFNPVANNSTNFTNGKWYITGGSRWVNGNNDNNTGAVPGSPVANFFTLDNGAYVNNGSHTLNANKGITLGVGGGTFNTTNGNMTFNGIITGGALTKVSPNMLSLGGANTYTGLTTIIGGTLQLGSGGTTGSLSTSSAIINNGNLSFNRTNTVTQGVDFNAGPITGTGSLTQAGTGTLVLNTANNYGGGTTVSAGTLSVSSAGALGSGNVTVQGTVAGTSLAIQSGVADAIDDSATLSLAGGGVTTLADRGYANLAADIAEFVSALVLGGNPQTPGLTYGSTSSGAAVQSNDYFAGTGIVSVGLRGDFNGDSSVDSGDYLLWRKNPSALGGNTGYDLWRSNFGATAAASGSSGSLSGQTAVPEPCAMVLGLVGGAVLTLLRGRRRKVM